MNDCPETGALRRAFVMAGAAAACGALALGASAAAEEEKAPGSGKLPITIAGYPYDRVRALRDKRLYVEGCDVTFEESSIGKMNPKAFSGPQSREVTEIGLSPFVLAYCNDGFRDYDLLPIRAGALVQSGLPIWLGAYLGGFSGPAAPDAALPRLVIGKK